MYFKANFTGIIYFAWLQLPSNGQFDYFNENVISKF